MSGATHIPAAVDARTLLSRVPMFSGLPPGELAGLAEAAIPRRFDAGEAIFLEGDRGDACYVLRFGCARVSRTHHDGRTIALAELRAPELFGELVVLGRDRRCATVAAMEPSAALALPGADLRRLLTANAGIALQLASHLADRLCATNDHVARRSFRPVPGRVAEALLAQVQTAQTLGAPASHVRLTTTHDDIAQMAGTSRETASRFLAVLERAGVITRGRRKLVVHDPAALRRYVW